jgi:NitT/TauT family transport system ATP-binding protein
MKVICKDVSMVYSTQNGSIAALQDITFEVGDQEFLCVLGPSGCGKTTLLKIFAGLLKPTTGEVIYKGEKSTNPLNSVVFQEHGIFPWLNVIDNVSFGLEMRGIKKGERYDVSRKFIRNFGLAGFEENYPHELSVGMKQRVSLARAFVNDPEILLMDEPFAALDAQTKLILQEELLRIWKEHKKSVIYVTHDIEEAILLGDRVIVMTQRPGRVKKDVPINLKRPRSIETENSEDFAHLKIDIWNLIRNEVHISIGV